MEIKFDIDKFSIDICYQRKFLRRLNLDQAKKLCGVSKATLSRIERKRLLDIDSFFSICFGYDLNPTKYFKVNKSEFELLNLLP